MIAINVSKKPDDFASESGHWYTQSGEPMYTIVGKNGNVRNTTLADARKLGLVPSVTTIAKVEAKPQLTNWLVLQGMMACMTLPRIPGETDTDFMARALEDSKKQVRAAAERGTYLHGLMEKSVGIMALHRDVQPEDEGYILPVLNWLYDNFPGYEWRTERSFANTELGFGGKIDLIGAHPTLPPVVIDYKCKDFDDPKKKLAYGGHCSQLVAYAVGLHCPYETSRLINIFISSTVPGLFVIKQWTSDEKIYGWRAFQAMIKLWKARNKF